MCKRVVLPVCFVAVLCLVGSASADIITWEYVSGDRDWCIGGNWSDGVPGPNDTAQVGTTLWGPIIGTGCDANVVELRGPYPSGPNTVIDIEGEGSLYVQTNWVLTRGGSGTVTINITDNAVVRVMGTQTIHLSPDSGTALFTMSGNPDAYFGGSLSAGDKTGGYHELNVHGGRLETGGGFGFGHDMAGGELNISGEDTEIYVGGGLGFNCRRPPAKLTLNMDGGLLDVAGTWEVGDWSDEDWTDPWAVELYLNGGRVICGNFDVQTKPEYPDGIPFLMDIDEGAVLEIRRADIAPTIRWWIDREPPFITGKDGTVKPKVAIVRGHTLVGFNLVQYEASNPSPGDAVGDVCPVGLTLSWDAGDYADQHKVYFGTDFNDVNDGSMPDATKSLGDETYDPGWLDYGQTYYWRVDEVNLTEPNEWKGVTWSFNTHSGKAEDPSPFNGQRGFMSGSTELNWDPPCYLIGQTLSYGDTFPQDGTWTEVELGPLEDSYTIGTYRFKNYYWRVDVNDGNNTITGDDWYFRTGWGGLLLHFKFDGTQGNDVPSPITDDSGNGLEFTKYTDGGSVKYGEPNPDNVLSTASADFEADAGLYRDDPCDPCEETPDLLRLDGSEYTVEVWLKPRKWTDLGTIWLLYKDGGWGLAINSLPGCGAGYCDASYRWMSNGSWTALTEDDTAKKDEWVHLAVVRDEGGDLGGIFLNGIEQEEGDTGGSGGQNPADNDSPVWIGAGGLAGGGFRAGDGFYDGLMDELRIHDIALAPCAFLLGPSHPDYPICPIPADNEMQVDPCSVVLSWTPGESATSHKVYFSTDVGAVEDVSAAALIYNGPNTSVPLTPLEYGTTYYWRVVEQPGGEEGDVWKFTTAYQVDDETLLLHYPFDETWGDTAYDVSGHGFHGDLSGNEYGWDPGDGQFGGSFNFNDDTAITAISPAGSLFDFLSGGVSISVWLKDAYRSDSDNWVLDAGYPEYRVRAAVVSDPEEEAYWRAGNDSNDVLTWDLDDQNPRALEEWHLWVFMKNEATGELSMYFDAELAASRMGFADTLSTLGGMPLRIGAIAGSYDDFVGKMDDLRVYDHAISESKIVELFRGGDLCSAWRPDPRDGSTDVGIDANLGWSPGDFATHHDVYIGTDLTTVTDANTSNPLGVYKGRQVVSDTNYSPPSVLELGERYFWRIDEVNENDSNLCKGKVWQFIAANFVVIDNFESYDDDNRIYYAWEDGVVNWSGATIDLGSEPFDPVHTGDQSMLYVYDNTAMWDFVSYHSMAELPFDSPADLTYDGQTRVLALYFYGDPTNDANDTEELYVGLRGSYAELRYSSDAGNDNNDLRLAEWTEWNIPLSEFISPDDVDETAVTSLVIGFGDSDNSTIVGGYGVMYFDDIRLYPPRCVPEFIQPVGDLSDDCAVTWLDVEIMAEEWLESDVNVCPMLNPGSPNLAGHWELEGDADDSSGNGYHGSAEGNYNWIGGKIGSGAIELNGGWVVVEDDGNTPLLRPADQVSVAAWIRLASSPPDSTRLVIKGRDDYESYATETSGDGFSFFIRDPNRSLSSVDSESDLPLHEWIHIAGTYNNDNNDLRVYVNGQVDANENVAGDVELFADANDGLGIGGRYGDSEKRFEGDFDDVRVYDRGLTRAEVAYIASQGTCIIPLDSEANLYSGEVVEAINIRDLAVLLDHWLEVKLWP